MAVTTHSWRRALLLTALIPVTVDGCRCPAKERPENAATADAESEVDFASRSNSLRPPPREPGPPRAETAEQLQKARKEAKGLVEALLKGGIAAREVASMADIRGYRLYRGRYFGQARIWFGAAVQADATYEPSLYNLARAAAQLGDLPAAARQLIRLQRLNTPLSRGRLVLAEEDPDLETVRRAASRGAAPPEQGAGPAAQHEAPE